MKEILEATIIALVDKKDEVSISQTGDDKTITFEVKVNKEDMGKVIGKQGRIAKAIRTLIKAVATKQQKKVTIEFVE